MINTLNCTPIVHANKIFFYRNGKDGSLLKETCDPLREKDRSVIDLKRFYINPFDGSEKSTEEFDKELKILFKALGFQEEALRRIYLDLGGDIDTGKKILHKKIKEHSITLERVGFSKAQNREGSAKEKANEPKFYLMVSETEQEGAYNTFHIGYSRKGTGRAVTRSKEGDCKVFAEAHAHAQKLSQEPLNPGICRIKNSEPAIKVSELGGCSLDKLNYESLSKGDIWNLCGYVAEALANLHERGLVHGDLKPQNIVALFDEKGKICGARLIDLDSLTAFGETIPTGTLSAYSPSRLLARNERRSFKADPSDDIWAFMITLCYLEASHVYKGKSQQKELISNPFIKTFFSYLNAESAPEKLALLDLSSKTSLFPKESASGFLDGLLVDIGTYDSQKTPKAREIAEHFHAFDGDLLDFFSSDWETLFSVIDQEFLQRKSLEIHVEGDVYRAVKVDEASSEKFIYQIDRKRNEDGSLSYKMSQSPISKPEDLKQSATFENAGSSSSQESETPLSNEENSQGSESIASSSSPSHRSEIRLSKEESSEKLSKFGGINLD